MRILVTQPLLGTAIERLREIGNVEVYPDARTIMPKAQLIEAARDCDILCCLLHDRIDAEVIDAAPSLVMISDGAINPTNVNITRARERGIVVANIPNIVAETTADMQWALLLAVARRVVEADRALRGGLFPGGQSLHFAGATVAGKTFGSIGYGTIARFSAKRAHGFGMRVLYAKPRRLAPADEASDGVEYRSLDELLRESDFVAINAAYGPETHHLIGEREFGLMKPGAYIINTARGLIIDESALVRALVEGKIAGAGLDVFENEPSVHPDLLAFENVVLTPHLGSASADTRVAIADCMVDNVLSFMNSQQIHRKF
jgi:glyoxylate reductase